jgi:Spy/CpxP family protein refolding chaperone
VQKAERRESRQEGLAERIAHIKDLDLTEAELAQISEIREEYRPQRESLLKELAGVLTDEQKESRLEALQSGETRREIRESLNLTDEQKQKVESIGKELAKVCRQKLQKMKAVLTPEQQKKVAEDRAERREHARDRRAAAIENAKELNLTSEQKTQIADIRKEYRPKVKEAGETLRTAVREELTQILAAFEG